MPATASIARTAPTLARTRDATRGFQRKDDRRTKLIAIASGPAIVYELPAQPGGHPVIATERL